jgi:3-hydroxypropanoate dehydrogenase
MAHILSDQDLDTIFRQARSYNRWSPEPVTTVQIQAIYDLLRYGPTSANCAPARFVFVTSAEGKAKLVDCVSEGNKVKVEQAPCTIIIGMDRNFAEKLPQLFPHEPTAKHWFSAPAVSEATMFRNATLQGAYLMIAARALGLDCGPMSGFDAEKLNAAFFAGSSVLANFICAIGHGTQERLFPRSPRLAFEEACTIA